MVITILPTSASSLANCSADAGTVGEGAGPIFVQAETKVISASNTASLGPKINLAIVLYNRYQRKLLMINLNYQITWSLSVKLQNEKLPFTKWRYSILCVHDDSCMQK
jgi:hypothetical protein